MIVLKAGVQFLSNFLTNCSPNQVYIWNELIQAESSLISTLTECALTHLNDEMLISNIAMLVFNCVVKSPERQLSLISSPGAKSLLSGLLTYLSTSGLDPAQAKSFYWMYAAPRRSPSEVFLIYLCAALFWLVLCCQT